MEFNPTDSAAMTPQGSGETLLSPATVNQRWPRPVQRFLALTPTIQLVIGAITALLLAIVVATVLWSQRTEYGKLLSNIPEKEMGEVLEALEKLNVKYKIDPLTGTIQVPSEQVYELRFKLASQGLPKDSSVGFELLEKETGFGMSQLMENARYQRALEGEIARSIMALDSVKSARIHLALPKESVFVRQPKKTSASVVLGLKGGRALTEEQVNAIVYLVATSVPQLEPEQVTVVDQHGHMLSQHDRSSELSLTNKQFEYKKQVEDHLIERIQNILSPVVGEDGVRTQVSVDLDFTSTERTQEVYNPDLPALRSEQISEEQNRLNKAQGIPGALTNQPPPAGVAPEVATGQSDQNNSGEPLSLSKNATRNYELDRTISHSRLATGVLRRLSVAVVVDNQHIPQSDGKIISKQFSDEDLTRFSDLVKEAVGYDPNRGDRVTITNAMFLNPDVVNPSRMWEQDWFWNVLEKGVITLLLLVFVFVVIRPLVKSLMGPGKAEIEAQLRAELQQQQAEADKIRELEKTEMPETDLAEDQLSLGQHALPGKAAENQEQDEDELFLLEAPQTYEKRLDVVKRIFDEEPKRAVQVIKAWLEPEKLNG